MRCGCGVTYVGETKKKVETRAKEHEKYVFKGQWKESAAAEHASTCSKEFLWDETDTICTETDYRRRKVREALEIRRHHRSETIIINRDQGTILKSGQWNVLLGRITDDLKLTSAQ